LTAIWKNDPALQPMARAELKNMRCAPFAVVPAVVSFFLKPSRQASCYTNIRLRKSENIRLSFWVFSDRTDIDISGFDIMAVSHGFPFNIL
jgi:hypothetical protein